MKRTTKTETNESTVRKNQAAEKLAAYFIAALEKGVAPWRKTWTGGGAPCNLDGKRYRGINRIFLAWMMDEQGFESPFFLTFSRIQALGGRIRKGQHGFPVVFWKTYDKTIKRTNEDGEEVEMQKRAGVWRHYYVWNIAQVDIPADALPKAVRECLGKRRAPLAVPAEIEAAGEAVWQGYANAPKRLPEQGASAFYSPDADAIQLPPRANFDSAEAYYSTLFHEMTHSTGHSSRLNRLTRGAAYGTDSYGREELVAEMGAALLCQRAGFLAATQGDSASYLAAWVETIRAQPSILLSAASAAQKAVDWICGDRE